MVDSTEAPVVRGGAAVAGGPGRPQLGQPRGGRRARAPGSTRSSRWPASTAPPWSAPASTPRARPAPPTGRCGPPRAIHDLAVERYGLEPSRPDLRRAGPARCRRGWRRAARDGIETLEGIRGSRPSCPACFTILGLSNVSFGLNPAARQVLNSVFLHECVQAGLDAAIVHAARIIPLSQDRRASPGDLPRPHL